MDAQQQYDTIETYLAGKLTGSALKEFEQEIERNAELAEKLHQHKLSHDALEVLIETNLREELNQLREEEAKLIPIQKEGVTKPQHTAKRRSLVYWISAAASALLLIGVFTFQSNQSSTDIFAQHYNGGYVLPESNRNGNQDEISPLAKGTNAYNSGNYENAINFFDNITNADNRYNEAQFYLGHSYLKNKAYALSAATFQKVATTGDLRYAEQAEWYQLLSLVANKQEDSTSFKTLLNKILADKGHSYHKQTQRLNADLQK